MPLAKLKRKRGHKWPISGVKGNITTDPTCIKNIQGTITLLYQKFWQLRKNGQISWKTETNRVHSRRNR